MEAMSAQEVNGQDFELNLTQAHYWGHNHIVYAAPDATSPQLAGLVDELESRLRRHRFHFEKRSYKPHVTLLRNALWSDAPLPRMPVVRWQINDFVLVRSLNDERGARYEVLARFGLKYGEVA
jgi:2'-5' RNA ligase